MKFSTRPGHEAQQRKGWLAAYRWLLLRRFTQLTVIVLFLLGPFAGIWIVKGNLASSELFGVIPLSEPLITLQLLASGFIPLQAMVIGTLLVIIFYALVGGRVYCSWFCPVNVITDSASWLRERLKITTSVKLHRSVRFWVLTMVILLPIFTGTMAYESVNPVAMIHRAIIYGLGMTLSVAVALFLYDLLLQRKGWCGHLCPMGALYSIIGRFSPLRVRADKRQACNDCMECFVVCPEPQVIKPALKGAGKGVGPVILDSACTNCGRCIDICAEDVFNFGLRWRNQGDQPD
ncbi:MAG: quinol dehydrogenase ferredoxin subunit NapH [Gammaproteobacteria bacterium]|nr:quinol dehydrogenase ferredoxin subunit NapH [Gammaproteobacteria bacterium]